MAKNTLPNIELLHNILSYDPTTGIFVWKVLRGRAVFGRVAGTTEPRGYCIIRINGISYYAHRLAWKMGVGGDPALDIDHIDGDKSNNRICNLREATNAQNHYNIPAQRNNTSGHKGVTFDRQRSKWRAQICINGQQKYLGAFYSIEDAVSAHKAAANAFHGSFVFASLIPS